MTLSGHPMIRAVEEACNFHNRIRDWSRSFGTDVAIWILFGFRLGHRNSNPEDDLGRSHVNALQAALLGLFALLLAFNFAMAASRFETRKALIQEEVDSSRQRSHERNFCRVRPAKRSSIT